MVSSKMYTSMLRTRITSRRFLVAQKPLSATTKLSQQRWASSGVKFNWEDPLNAANLLTDEELAIQDTARQYCQEQLQPRVLGVCVCV